MKPGGGRRNYTGIMTRTIVYSGTLVGFLAGTFQRLKWSEVEGEADAR